MEMQSSIQQAWAIAKECKQESLCKFLEGGSDDQAKDNLAKDILNAQKEYPGGLHCYLNKIVQMMKEYVENKTKYDDCVLRPPNTYSLCWDNLPELRRTDKLGTPELKKLAFFLLGGGLGERLGYNGAKPNMAIDSINQQSYLSLFCYYIKEYQKLSGTILSK